MTGSFLDEPPTTPQAQSLYDDDIADSGFIRNFSRLWAYQPETIGGLFELMTAAFEPSGLSFRERGILVAATASTRGDSYCSLAWGGKLAGASDAQLASGVLSGKDEGLTEQEAAIASWTRSIVKDPNATSPADVQKLRDAGLSDRQIFAITAFVSLRLAFSTVNDALGARPDAQLAASLPSTIVEAVNYGRPVQE